MATCCRAVHGALRASHRETVTITQVYTTSAWPYENLYSPQNGRNDK